MNDRQQLINQLETLLMEQNKSIRLEEILNELERILEHHTDDDEPFGKSGVPRKPD